MAPPGVAVRLVMEARTLFRGRVVSQDGEPVPHFRVDDHDVTSPDGRFEVPLTPAGDRVIASVEASGFEPLMLDKPAQPTELGDLVLERSPSVTGRVRDEGGGAVADAVVGCDACEDSVMTGPDGHALPPLRSKFNLTAHKGRLSASAQTSRGDSQPVELVLQFSHAAVRGGVPGQWHPRRGRPARGGEHGPG